MPGAEVAFGTLIAVVIVSLLAIQRRARLAGKAEPVVISVATGIVLGLVASLVGAAVIGAIVSILV